MEYLLILCVALIIFGVRSNSKNNKIRTIRKFEDQLHSGTTLTK